MPRYLVETYVPGTREPDARATGRRASEAARIVSREGQPIRYVRTTLLPGEETCFHVFDADSPDAVVLACRIAEIEAPRIVFAIE